MIVYTKDHITMIIQVLKPKMSKTLMVWESVSNSVGKF